LTGPLSAARAGGTATEDVSSASASAAGMTREDCIKTYL